MHADVTLTIRKGSVQIKQSYEGLEANTIQIKGGKIQVKASDDGINAAGNLGNPLLTIDGGTIYVDADGDGVDSNQDIVMNDGTLIVMGPENGGNGALDYDGSFAMNGGTLVAVGTVSYTHLDAFRQMFRCVFLRRSDIQQTNGRLFLFQQ